jgi:hypothetical protein
MTGSSFDPETISTLQEVLDSSVDMLPARFQTPACTVDVACQLLSAAANGHRSKKSLVEVGRKAVDAYRNDRGFT